MLEHEPVLLTEVIDALQISSEGYYVDCTFGRGGHAQAILKRLNENGRLLALDRDPYAIASANALAAADSRFQFERSCFDQLQQVVSSWIGRAGVDGVLFDLGVSSPQLEDPERGFSFSRDGAVDMRMDPDSGESAASWLARAGLKEIAQVLRDYGDERYAKRIAKAIVATRAEQAIVSTKQLAEVIVSAAGKSKPGIHPATKSFQAIRIFINQELEQLRQGLQQALDVLKPQGRLVVISFHSLEDRIVKRFMRTQARGDDLPPDFPVTDAARNPSLEVIGKPIHASRVEVDRNPRARSAVLRVARRLA